MEKTAKQFEKHSRFTILRPEDKGKNKDASMTENTFKLLHYAGEVSIYPF